MRKILSYAKSHIYDIHAVLAGMIVLVLMYYIKKPIKARVVLYVDAKIRQNPKLSGKRKVLQKRYNAIIILFTMILALGVFTILSLVSSMIEFSFQTGLMSGVYALCEYAVVEQFTCRRKEDC